MFPIGPSRDGFAGCRLRSSGPARERKVAARACANCVPPDKLAAGTILPTVGEIRRVSRTVALAVAEEAVRSGVAEPRTREQLEEALDLEIWEPQYMELVRADE